MAGGCRTGCFQAYLLGLAATMRKEALPPLQRFSIPGNGWGGSTVFSSPKPNHPRDRAKNKKGYDRIAKVFASTASPGARPLALRWRRNARNFDAEKMTRMRRKTDRLNLLATQGKLKLNLYVWSSKKIYWSGTETWSWGSSFLSWLHFCGL